MEFSRFLMMSQARENVCERFACKLARRHRNQIGKWGGQEQPDEFFTGIA